MLVITPLTNAGWYNNEVIFTFRLLSNSCVVPLTVFSHHEWCWQQQCSSMCQRWTVITNTVQNNRVEAGLMNASGWAGEVKCAIFFSREMTSSPAVWRDCHTTLHVSSPKTEKRLDECTEADGKERIGVPLYFPSPCAAARICQAAGALRGGPECPGSSFIVYTDTPKRDDNEFQAKVVILQKWAWGWQRSCL